LRTKPQNTQKSLPQAFNVENLVENDVDSGVKRRSSVNENQFLDKNLVEKTLPIEEDNNRR